MDSLIEYSQYAFIKGSSQTTISLNDNITHFKCQKILRQDDPLSPFFFQFIDRLHI
jgi:hypothetical protein